MADVVYNETYFKVTGADVNRYIIGTGNDSWCSTIAVVLQATTPVGVSFTVEARAYNALAAASWYPWLYRSAYLNGAAVATFALAATAVTTNSILHIPATGLQIALNLSGHTSGTLEFYVNRYMGAMAV